jgi:DnaJ-domain-containing protein 1
MNGKLHQEILKLIMDEPGTSRKRLRDLFNLTEYRLKRVFRHIGRELSGKILVHDRENGVWIVTLDPKTCLGVEWVGIRAGGYIQCSGKPDFPDRRCWCHSQWENPELTALERRLYCLAGPCDPTPHSVAQVSLTTVEELLANLRMIVPATLNDRNRKQKLMQTLLSGLALAKWKDMMRRRRMEPRLRPEFAERHRRSSGNPFEFGLKQHFLILEVPPESTKEQVLKAWRRLARRYHPDTSTGDEEKMKTINLAKDRIFRIRQWD